MPGRAVAGSIEHKIDYWIGWGADRDHVLEDSRRAHGSTLVVTTCGQVGAPELSMCDDNVTIGGPSGSRPGERTRYPVGATVALPLVDGGALQFAPYCSAGQPLRRVAAQALNLTAPRYGANLATCRASRSISETRHGDAGGPGRRCCRRGRG